MLQDESTTPMAYVEHDVLCLSCGYNLRGLHDNGLCPECGTKVRLSLRGDLLRFCDTAWLESVALGINLKLWGIGLQIVGGILFGVLIGLAMLPEFVLGLLTLAGAGLSLWAAILITRQEPRVALQEDPISLRRVIRTGAVAGFVGGMLSLGQDTTLLGFVLALLSMVGSLGGIVATFGELIYFRRMAVRIPDEKLALSTGHLFWTAVVSGALMIPFLAVFTYMMNTTQPPGGGQGTMSGVEIVLLIGMCILGVVLLYCFLWYVRLLTKYRKAFREAAVQSREDAAGTDALVPGMVE